MLIFLVSFTTVRDIDHNQGKEEDISLGVLARHGLLLLMSMLSVLLTHSGKRQAK